MIEGFFSMLWWLIKLILWGLWVLVKILSKAFYIFVTEHPRYAFLLPILLIAAYYRYQYIASSVGVIGVAEKDILIAQEHLNGTITLIGSNVIPGGFSLGPFYNYLISPSLWFTDFDPFAPAKVAALIGVATVYLVYVIGKRFFNLQAGLFAAGLYAVSPFVFSYAHESWRLDILPFFVLLLLLVVFNASASARPLLSYLSAGFLLGLCLQLHYVSFFLSILIFIYVLVTEVVVNGIRFFLPVIKRYLEIVVGFIISLIPFLLHEFSNNFSNSKTMATYLFELAADVGFANLFTNIPQTFFNLFARPLINYPSVDQAIYYSSSQLIMLGIFVMVLAVSSLIVLIFVRNKFIILLLGMWFVLGIIFLTLFQKSIYDYHFTPLFPVVYLLVGNLLASFFHLQEQQRVQMAKQLISTTDQGETYTEVPVDVTNNTKLLLHRLCITGSLLLFSLMFVLNISVLPLQIRSEEQLVRINKIAEFVISKTSDKVFNFALISDPPARGKIYREVMSEMGYIPLVIEHPEIDPRRKTVAEQLFIVCEDPNCKPLENTLWDVKGFGRAAIHDEWKVADIKVYRLVHIKDREVQK